MDNNRNFSVSIIYIHMGGFSKMKIINPYVIENVVCCNAKYGCNDDNPHIVLNDGNIHCYQCTLWQANQYHTNHEEFMKIVASLRMNNDPKGWWDTLLEKKK